MAQNSSVLPKGSSLLIPARAFWETTHSSSCILPLDDTGKISSRDSIESMLVGRVRAFRSKRCPFWVNFGYVVPEIKYAPKLVELISNNGHGMIMAYIS